MRFSSCLMAFSFLVPLLAHGDNARDWQNLPKDLNIVFGYYSDLNTNTSIDTTLPVDGLSLDADLYILRYAYSFDVAGRNTAVQLIQPYADIEASLDGADFLTGNKKDGSIGDTQVVLAHNLFGGPALTAEEFAKWTPETFLSGAIWVTLPDGDYDKNQAINIGANRWVFKPEVAFGHPIGPTWIELNAWVSLYGDNNDYRGDNKLEQDPLWTIEGHYSYTVNRALWISLDGSWGTGGETQVNGADQHNEQENAQLGASLGFMLSQQFGGMVSYMNTVSEQTGSPEVDIWTFRLQYLW